MGKPTPVQHYRSTWQSYPWCRDWLRPVDGNNILVYCAFCKVELQAHLGALSRHVKTKKHQTSAEPFCSTRQMKINLEKEDDVKTKKREAEAAFSLYCAMHGSIRGCEHLSDINNKLNRDVKVQMRRSKCSNIIKNVISPHFEKNLIEDIGDSPYSLLVDESTDISSTKLLGIVIRYYSRRNKEFVSTYLAIVEVDNGTAEAISESIKEVLEEFNLPTENLKGLGTDNASVMVGAHSGVYERLKRDLNLPNLMLVKFICHSIQLVVSRASTETLPRNIEFLIRETYKWFSHSSKRQKSYKEIYQIINAEEIPLKMIEIADTRWLSIEPAVTRIVSQWLELKTHFEIVRLSENCYTAELLYSMYNDNANYVYLAFLLPVLQDMQSIVKSFESNVADPTKLLDDLKNVYESVVKRVINPSAKIDVYKDRIDSYLDPSPYLGYSFDSACLEYPLSPDVKIGVKQRCISFLISLAKELKDRLPSHLNIMEKIRYFSVSECLKRIKPPVTHVAKTFVSDKFKITKIENQWNCISNIRWENVQNTLLFWSEVESYRDASGLNPFSELAELAITLLVLPLSNADVERIFSQMGLIKNKLRNRMLLPMLRSILYIKYGLRRHHKCCYDYVLPKSVIGLIGTKETYESRAFSKNVNTENSTTVSIPTDEDYEFDKVLEFFIH